MSETTSTVTTAASASPIAVVTTLGQTAISQAIAGEKLTIAYAAFGSDLIYGYTEESLLSLTDVVSNGAASEVYKSDSSVITYSFPQAGEVQFKVNLGTTVGDFSIGNWGLFDSSGNLLFIIALSALDTKLKTTSYQAGDNRVYTLNIPITSSIESAIDFSVISLDAASLPEVTTEGNLPEADKASYPVFHVQDYDSTGSPCLASRIDDTWYYYLPYVTLLESNNTWTGTNTFNNSLLAKTVGTDDNSDNVATTAFVNNFSQSLMRRSTGSISANSGYALEWNGEEPVFSYNSGKSLVNLATQTFSEGSFSDVSNGYQIFPSGLIIQWGGGTIGNTPFNIPFPNACFWVFATNTNSQGTYVDNAFAFPYNNSEFYIQTKSSNSDVVSSRPTAWFAIGY